MIPTDCLRTLNQWCNCAFRKYYVRGGNNWTLEHCSQTKCSSETLLAEAVDRGTVINFRWSKEKDIYDLIIKKTLSSYSGYGKSTQTVSPTTKTKCIHQYLICFIFIILSSEYHISVRSPFIQFWAQQSPSCVPKSIKLSELCVNKVVVSTRTCWPDACCFYLLLMKMKPDLNTCDAIGVKNSWELSAAPLYVLQGVRMFFSSYSSG